MTETKILEKYFSGSGGSVNSFLTELAKTKITADTFSPEQATGLPGIIFGRALTYLAEESYGHTEETYKSMAIAVIGAEVMAAALGLKHSESYTNFDPIEVSGEVAFALRAVQGVLETSPSLKTVAELARMAMSRYSLHDRENFGQEAFGASFKIAATDSIGQTA